MYPVRGFERHLVFYRERDDGIEIVRVLHGARDIPSVMDE
jgi:toxin ParE1/3/4